MRGFFASLRMTGEKAGMTMQKRKGWLVGLCTFPPIAKKRDGWGTRAFVAVRGKSRFLRLAAEWKCENGLVGLYFPTHRKTRDGWGTRAFVLFEEKADSSPLRLHSGYGMENAKEQRQTQIPVGDDN